MDVLDLMKQMQPCLRNRAEAVVAFVHCVLRKHGFVDSNADNSAHTVPVSDHFPFAWNATPDSYSFEYTHPQLVDDRISVKAIVLGGCVLVHGSTKLQSTGVLSLELKVAEITTGATTDGDEQQQQPPPDSLDELFVNATELAERIDQALVSRWLNPQAQPSTTTPKPTSSTPPRQPVDLRVPPRSHYGTSHSPLQDPPHFGVGHGDLNGPDLYGLPGFGSDSGMVVGPGHSMFGARRGPPRGVPQFGGFPPPPGARFDPFGPTPGFGGPNPSHERRPNFSDYDSMYM